MITKRTITGRTALVALGACLLIGGYNYSIAQWQEGEGQAKHHHIKNWCDHHQKWVTKAGGCKQAFGAHIKKEKHWCSKQASPLTGKECKKAYEQQEHQHSGG